MRNSKHSKKSLSDRLIKNKESKFDNRFKLAPKGVLMMALSKYYMPRIKNGLKCLEQFETELMQQLSLLATDGKVADELGKDFNEFFKYFIQTINKCNGLEEAIRKQGLDIIEDSDEQED